MDNGSEEDAHQPGSAGEVAGRSRFETAQRRVFEESGVDVQSRFVDLVDPRVRTHVLEAGNPDGDPPLLFVHGTTWFGAYFAPLMAELDGTRMLAIDRPGWGLSGNFEYRADNHRKTARNVLVGVLDELGIEQVDLVGNSTGGYWSILFSLAHPRRVRRLILLGGVATFPGTRTPFQVRLLTLPGLNQLLALFREPGEQAVVTQMEQVGDGEAISRYPALIRAKVAQDRAPRSFDVSVRELRSMVTFLGWRSATRLREEELRDLQPPATFIWGKRDWFGGPGRVRDTVSAITSARLEPVDAGHAPWFGQPGKCAGILRDVRS